MNEWVSEWMNEAKLFFISQGTSRKQGKDSNGEI